MKDRKTCRQSILTAIGVTLMAAGLTGTIPLAALAKADDEKAVVAPMGSLPEGQTYGRWAAQWQEWVVGIPAAENPLTDATGQNCGQRQVDRVWFLAGTSGSDPVVRACDVPADKALFFPLIENAYFAFLSDPPEQRTEEFVRSQAECTQPVQISASIDGRKVAHPQRFFTGPSGSESPIFNVQLPPGKSLRARRGHGSGAAAEPERRAGLLPVPQPAVPRQAYDPLGRLGLRRRPGSGHHLLSDRRQVTATGTAL